MIIIFELIDKEGRKEEEEEKEERWKKTVIRVAVLYSKDCAGGYSAMKGTLLKVTTLLEALRSHLWEA